MTDYQNMLNNSIGSILLQASFDGRLKSAEGVRTTIGVLVSLTAASGKDLYLTAAKISGRKDGTSSQIEKIELQIDDVVKETFTTIHALSGFGYLFDNIGLKIVSGSVVEIEIITIGILPTVEGFIQAIEVPTGENPLEYRGE